MIQRKAHNIFAPKPMKHEPEPERKTYTYRPAETKPLKLSDYWMSVYASMFARWNK